MVTPWGQTITEVSGFGLVPLGFCGGRRNPFPDWQHFSATGDRTPTWTIPERGIGDPRSGRG